MRISDWSSDVCSSDLDTYGHAAGDIVLCRVADILERIVRRTDLVARPGGDEFTIVLVGIDNISKIEQIAQTIIDAVRKPLDIGNELQVQIGASIGIALIRPDDDSPSSALPPPARAMLVPNPAGPCPLPVA